MTKSTQVHASMHGDSYNFEYRGAHGNLKPVERARTSHSVRPSEKQESPALAMGSANETERLRKALTDNGIKYEAGMSKGMSIVEEDISTAIVPNDRAWDSLTVTEDDGALYAIDSLSVEMLVALAHGIREAERCSETFDGLTGRVTCSVCGEHVSPRDRYCSGCGARFTRTRYVRNVRNEDVWTDQ